MLRCWLGILTFLTAGVLCAADLQVCTSEEELIETVQKAGEPFQFSEQIQDKVQPCAAIAVEDEQAYLYFLGRIDNIEKIPAAELDNAIAFHFQYALLPTAAVRVTFYQKGSRMLALRKGEKGSQVISWYMDNEKMTEVTAARANHYTAEQLTKDSLEKLDAQLFSFIDINKTENLGTFLLKGETRSFVFFGRIPVENSFVKANKFPVLGK